MQKYNVDNARAEDVNSETRTFAIEGMTCDNCVRTIVKILRGIDGVKSFEVSRKDARANVSFDATKTNIAAIHEAMQRGGYKARAFADADAPAR
jgi:copper chaperone CopZ